jgi:hypothetical protein
MLKFILLGLVVLIGGALAFVRLAPNDPTHWHVDISGATRTTSGGWLVLPTGGDAPSPVFAVPAPDLMAMLDRIALDTSRTTLLAGSVAEGRLTYMTRSALIGFPDFTTVQTTDTPDGTALMLFARQRFGDGDMGVNRARAEDWLAKLQAATTP